MGELSWTSSTKTKLNLIKIGFELKANKFDQTEQEIKDIWIILSRFDRMRSARTIVDKFYQLAQLQFEAQFIPYTDWRSRSNVPLEWAIIELFVSEALQRTSEVKVSALWEADITKVEVMKRVESYVRTKYWIQEQLYKNEYITSIFWTSYYLTAFTQEARIIEEINELWTDWDKKILKNNKIIIKALDPRNVYLDDRTIDFNDDNDQIFIDYITPEQLESLKLDPNFKNLDKVNTYTKQDQAFFTSEERWKQNDQVIEFMHYFNKWADRHIILANRQIEVKRTPLPYAHKELPIVPRQYWYNPLTKHWRGLCEALLSFKSNINQLQEMIMDWIRRSNNSMFVISNWLTFDWDNFGFNNTLIKSNWPVWPENFQEIRWQQPNNAIFQYSQDLLKQVAIYVWIDPAAIMGQASSTAFETAVRQDTSLKRVNVALMNRDLALKKVYDRHISNIMQFFPIKTAQWLYDVNEKQKEKHPTIVLKNEKYVNWEFVELPWNFAFEVKPELIRWQYDIEVTTNFNAPSIKSLKIERYKDFAIVMLQLAQMSQIPWISDKIPFDKLIDEMLYDFDIDIETIWGMSWSLKDKKQQILDKLHTLAWLPWQADQWQWINQWTGWSTWPWWEPTVPQETTNRPNTWTGIMLWWQELGTSAAQPIRKKVWWVMMPATPNIQWTSPAVNAMQG